MGTVHTSTERPARYSPETIIAAVAAAFGIDPSEVYRGRRTAQRTTARQLAAYLLHRTDVLSYSDVARILLYKNHTTARDGACKTQARIAAHFYFADLVRSIEVELQLRVTGQERAGPAAGAAAGEPQHHKEG